MRRRKSLIQVAPSNDRPPIIQEYFDWPPIRDPSENKQALFNDTTDRTRRKVDDCLASDDGEGEYRETNGHRSSADAKQLVKIEPDNSGAIAKILSESCTEFVSLRRRSFCLRQMHNDPEWLIGRKLSRPSDDEFLYIVVEIFFAVRKGIQTMKELGDFLDPNLDRIRGSRRICAAIYIRCMPHLVNDLRKIKTPPSRAPPSCWSFADPRWRVTPPGLDGARTSRMPAAPPRRGLQVLQTGALLLAQSSAAFRSAAAPALPGSTE